MPAERRKRRFSIGVVAVVAFAALPMLVRLAGFPFLPSTSWVAMIGGFAPWISSGLGVALFVLLMRFIPEDAPMRIASGLKRWLYQILLLLICWLLANFITMNHIPFFWSIAVRDAVSHNYVVADPRYRSSRWCDGKLELSDMPFGTDHLCGIPREARERLRVGTVLIVSGMGSSLGLFPRTIDVVVSE